MNVLFCFFSFWFSFLVEVAIGSTACESNLVEYYAFVPKPISLDLFTVNPFSGVKLKYFEENKTVKSCFSCSLSSLLGFWGVWEPFWEFFYFVPLTTF